MHPAGHIRELPTNHRLRSEEHTSELQSQSNLVCRLLLEKKKNKISDILLTRYNRSAILNLHSSSVKSLYLTPIHLICFATQLQLSRVRHYSVENRRCGW